MILNKKILNNLRTEYGDAFYLLDSEQFRKNYIELKSAFSDIYPNFNIAYSYKTNYTPKLCKIVNKLGGYAEVVSEMELELALRIGADAKKIIWNGPVKNYSYFEDFLLAGGTINLDSDDEFKWIEEIAKKHPDNTINVGIRCNFDVKDGVISRFGFDVDGKEFDSAWNLVNAHENIKLINLQCHFAKRQVEYWPARAQGMVDLVNRLGFVPERIDLGGGIFGKMPEELKKQFSSRIPDYDEYAEAAATIVAKAFEHSDIRPELLIEPGSALVGDCMKFVGTIKTIKTVKDKTFVTVLGSQKNISMAGVNPPIEIIAMGGEQSHYENADVVGFTCIECDTLYKNYTGDLAVGDVIVISNCGSYSLVMKPPFILPNFPVLDICDGNIEVIKRKECFDDIFHTFNF